jgi:phosphoesterase RecJ-like protein
MNQNYPLSKSILSEIKKADNILINVHRNPDLDSVGSATALYQALIKLGKKATLICPHEVPENFKFLNGADEILRIDFSSFNFSPYNLFLILDSGSFDIVTGDKEVTLPNTPKIIIDHHQTNNWTSYLLKLLDIEASSTAEVVYQLFLDWSLPIDQMMATSIFAGISSDTVFFKYEKNAKKTFKIAAELLDLGADKDKIVERSFDSFDLGLVRLIGEFLTKIQVGDGYIYSILDNKTFIKFGGERGAREIVANLFGRSVKGFDFGIMAVEYEKDKFAVSFRSKSTDVSIIAEKFGGGGHKNAAGATIFGTIDQVIDKIKKVSVT